MMKTVPIIKLVFFAILFFSCSKAEDFVLDIESFPNRTGDFTLWQLEQYNQIPQMGYILKTDDNKIVIVDGGVKQMSKLLHDYIIQLGGTVHYWILTHPHHDHVGALDKLLKTKSTINIENIIHSKLDLDLIKKHEPKSYDFIFGFYKSLNESGLMQTELEIGQEIFLGEEILLKIFGNKNPEILVNLVNNSSLIFQISSKFKSVLFTGDLGIEGGDKVLENISNSEIKSTHVQMAHHGQAGVSQEFYTAVEAKIALWPTPKWLWNNNLDSKGFDTGKWKTITVRNWMNELQIQKNIVSGIEGTIQIN